MSSVSALATLVMIAFVALAPLAAAQSPTDAQYDSSEKAVQRAAGGGGEEQSGGGTLPFTGTDALALGIVALSLGAAGAGLRRLTATGGR